MNFRNIVYCAIAAILGIAAITVGTQAQGPLYDKVIVNLPYTVSVGDRMLQPGEYVIRQLPSDGGGSRVLLIYSDNGMKFETSSMTIPALDNRTPEDTKVILHHFGNDYYFDKIWIQGKNYGYEFPVPESVKSRQRERTEPVNVAARYEASPAETTTTAETEKKTESESAVATTQPSAPPPAAPQPSETTTAQTQPPPAPVEEAPAPSPSAERMAPEREMPSTAANWVMMLLSGGALSSAGLALRRSIR
jgi:hypothetical protein